MLGILDIIALIWAVAFGVFIGVAGLGNETVWIIAALAPLIVLRLGVCLMRLAKIGLALSRKSLPPKPAATEAELLAMAGILPVPAKDGVELYGPNEHGGYADPESTPERRAATMDDLARAEPVLQRPNYHKARRLIRGGAYTLH